MSLYTPIDGAIGLQLASPYVAGSGSLVLKAGQGARFVTFPTIVTAITNASYNTGAGEVLCEYTVTGKSGDTLTGVAAVAGFTDQNFATNDFVEGRVSVKYLIDAYAALGKSFATVASEATLAGSRVLTAGSNITLTDAGAGSTLTIAATGGGGSGTVNSGTGGQIAYYPATAAAVSSAAKLGYDITNACPLWTAIADPAAPVVGDKWYSSPAGGLVTCRAASGGNFLNTMEDGTFFRCTNCTALANSAAQATLLASPTASWGSLTIPSGALLPGQWIDIDFQGVVSTTGTPTFQPVLKFGTVTVLPGSAVALASSITNLLAMNWGGLRIVARTVGASGSLNGGGVLRLGQQNYILTTNASEVGTDITGVNFNQANALDFQGQWGTGSASNSIQVLSFIARLKG